MARIPLADRFRSKVDSSGGEDSCWNWTACKTPIGYGKIGKGGDEGWVFSHRVAFELANGNLPEGMVVMHLCDNPSCCNPLHLRAGTQAENLRDMRAKGRDCRGEKMSSALYSSDKFLARPKRSPKKSKETGRFVRETI